MRRDIKIAHDRLDFEEFLSSSAGRLAAQESIVTSRRPLRRPNQGDFRGEVRGIVHDVSSQRRDGVRGAFGGRRPGEPVARAADRGAP